eukprot:TRINITY_DN81837_c0_g1_i1.p1 TRINITY_DN81837_c0_g1~~TRINITY_DN81837_c0_g1_i1.p1  ORF type:complete len:426 (-),score=95.89 TRINITY_DN81837_c0_g1_i1:376-1653(-)
MPADDVKKKAAASAASRTRKNVKNSSLSYGLWIGGSIGSIAVACVVLWLSPDKGKWGALVNDESAISHVNKKSRSWRAGASAFFDGWTLGDVRTLEGTGLAGLAGPCTDLDDSQVPENFDARKKWPQCFKAPVYSMGNCSASWALATASAFSSRMCVAKPSEHADRMLSPQQLLSCDEKNRGCQGGNLDSAWNYIVQHGLVSEGCLPYQADSSVSCESKCRTDTPVKAGGSCVLTDELKARRAIFTGGPVVAPLFLADDFLIYKQGLYEESPTATQMLDSKGQRLMHAVKVIGWGSMEGKKYWLIENSWGEDWGEQGYAKILRGGNVEKREVLIAETYMIAGKLSDSAVAGAASAGGQAEVDLADVDIDEADLEDVSDGEEAGTVSAGEPASAGQQAEVDTEVDLSEVEVDQIDVDIDEADLEEA